MNAEPWFDPNMFGALYGGIVGGGGGALIGVVCGIGAILAPSGRGKWLQLGTLVGAVLFGLVSLGFGVYALVAAQPYGIWYPLLLVGMIMTLVSGPLIPVVQARYAQAEQRRVEAESLRRS